jgi:hypothetical protein
MEEQLNTEKDVEKEKSDAFFRAAHFRYWYGVKEEEEEEEEGCCSFFHEHEIINPKELFNHNN